MYKERQEKEKRKKYNPNDIFKNRTENRTDEKCLIEYKECFIKRIINKIKSYWK